MSKPTHVICGKCGSYLAFLARHNNSNKDKVWKTMSKCCFKGHKFPAKYIQSYRKWMIKDQKESEAFKRWLLAQRS